MTGNKLVQTPILHHQYLKVPSPLTGRGHATCPPQVARMLATNAHILVLEWNPASPTHANTYLPRAILCKLSQRLSCGPTVILNLNPKAMKNEHIFASSSNVSTTIVLLNLILLNYKCKRVTLFECSFIYHAIASRQFR